MDGSSSAPWLLELWSRPGRVRFLGRSRCNQKWVAARKVAEVLVIIAFSLTPLLVIKVAGWHPWGYSANSALVDPVYIDLTSRLGNLANLVSLGDIYRNFQFEAFTYPPGAIFFFFPLMWMNYWLDVTLWTIASLTSLFFVVFLVSRKCTGFRTSTLTQIATSALISLLGLLALPAVYECISLGQTALLLLAMVAVDYFVVPPKFQGYLTGAATAIKLYPVLFLLWWMVRRKWLPTIRGIAVMVILTVGSAIAWPQSSRTYWRHIVFGGGEVAKLDSGLKMFANSSIDSPLLRPPLVSQPIPLILQVVILLFAMSFFLWIALKLSETRPVTTFFVLCLGSAMCSLVAWDHYLVFVVLLPFVVMENKETWAKICLSIFAMSEVIPFWRMRYVGGRGSMAAFERLVGADGTWLISICLVIVFAAVAFKEKESRNSFKNDGFPTL